MAIQSWLATLPCRNAKHNYYRGVRAFVRWLWKQGRIPEDVTAKVTPPKTRKELLPVVTKEQLATLLATCRDCDRALIQLLWSTGARLGEVANIRAKDFDWDKGTVSIFGSKTNRYRKALVEGEAIRDWFSQHDSLELTSDGIASMLKRLSKATGIHCNPHSFRRGRCIDLLLAGYSTRIVQVLIGWETEAMVTKYSQSLSFDDALAVYRGGNGHS